ncbi:MAG: hypothetical protein JO140_03150 [Candidatus Eremiobacteraeota bacterium]|nr:hypothetical protein [Candidatus Eremiobacteraeota bacterium]
MRTFIVLATAFFVTTGTSAALTPTPSPNPSAIQALNKRMHLMLQDVAHKNEQAEVTMEPDPSGLKTIVKVRVHPSYNAQLRADLTKNVNEYIAINQGQCTANTTMKGMNAFALNPIHGGMSTTYVDVPFATLAGHGHNVSTYYPNGTVVNCGAY